MPAAREAILTALEKQRFNRLSLGIDDPVFAHAVLFVEIALLDTISPARARRQNFRHKIGGAAHAILDDVTALVGDKKHVWLGNACGTKNHVYGRSNRCAQTMFRNPLIK